jgi:hypothetical protein
LLLGAVWTARTDGEYLGDPGQGSINKIWDWTVANLLFSPYRNQPLHTIITQNC